MSEITGTHTGIHPRQWRTVRRVRGNEARLPFVIASGLPQRSLLPQVKERTTDDGHGRTN
jgi:hypothetical protein